MLEAQGKWVIVKEKDEKQPSGGFEVITDQKEFCRGVVVSSADLSPGDEVIYVTARSTTLGLGFSEHKVVNIDDIVAIIESTGDTDVRGLS